MSVRDRVSEHRKRLRAQGLRPIQIWVPDTRSEAFADEAKRQAVLVSAINAVSDDQDFVEAISITWDD
ncbi:MAG: antitoxin MazE family protein [Actinomycetes bacterium]